MTTVLDIANRALQAAGTRTNMSETEFTSQSSNEAIQTNLIIYEFRDELNRMAPWDFVTKFTNLTYVTSLPTTPENATAGPPMWQPGMPAPPWAYEYQYPVDCQRARYIIPQYTALAGGVPIYPAGTATGANQAGWTGPALKFKVSSDSFYAASAATINFAGSGYNVGDIIFLAQPTYTFTQNYTPLTSILTPQSFTMNVGAPAAIQVISVGAGGAVTGITLINQIFGENTSPSGGPTQTLSGSYFGPQALPIAQSYAIGTNGQTSNGTGFQANLTFTGPAPQRVILCNQENAILCDNTTIIDPNVMDKLFQKAWVNVLGAGLCYQLTGNKEHANELIAIANAVITEARKVDGNEGTEVNDVTPDFLRIRGNFGGPNWEFSPNMSFDWGSLWSPY